MSLRTRFSGNSTQLNFNSNQITYKITLESASHITYKQLVCRIFAKALILAFKKVLAFSEDEKYLFFWDQLLREMALH